MSIAGLSEERGRLARRSHYRAFGAGPAARRHPLPSSAVSTSVRPPTGEAFAGEPSGSSDEASSPFEPLAVERLYPRPRARVDPDTDKGWFRRMLPLVTAHKALLTGSAVAALVAMLAQVAVPAVVRAAIDRALVDETEALAPFVVALLLLAVTRGTLAFAYRYGLFRMAYEIEYDLRGLIFEHLAGLSFSFYDRVQSGQIISRANSDIRSVQMVLAFAPLMGMSMLSFVIAVAYMLINMIVDVSYGFLDPRIRLE